MTLLDRILVRDVDPYTADDDDLPRWRRAIGIDGPPPLFPCLRAWATCSSGLRR